MFDDLITQKKCFDNILERGMKIIYVEKVKNMVFDTIKEILYDDPDPWLTELWIDLMDSKKIIPHYYIFKYYDKSGMFIRYKYYNGIIL